MKTASLKSCILILSRSNINLNELLQNYTFILRIINCNSNTNNVTAQRFGTGNKLIVNTKSSSNLTRRSEDLKSSFMVNIFLFSESIQFNNFYYKKMFIDEDGNIFNSINNEYRTNLNEITFSNQILDFINSSEFSNLGLVNKDKIDICKECEFRYMCVDDRIPIKYDENKWKMIESCSYDPLKNVWL